MTVIPNLAAMAPAPEHDAGRSDRSRFRAFVRDKATEAILRDALGDLMPDDTAIRRADLAATRQALQRDLAPNVLILDVSGEDHPLRVLDDPAWVMAQVSRLTRLFESRQEKPWAITDAPEEFIERQVRAIVGLEIPLTRLEGKWKVSQNRTDADRARVAEGLKTGPMAGEVAAALAAKLGRSN